MMLQFVLYTTRNVVWIDPLNVSAVRQGVKSGWRVALIQMKEGSLHLVWDDDLTVGEQIHKAKQAFFASLGAE